MALVLDSFGPSLSRIRLSLRRRASAVSRSQFLRSFQKSFIASSSLLGAKRTASLRSPDKIWDLFSFGNGKLSVASKRSCGEVAFLIESGPPSPWYRAPVDPRALGAFMNLGIIRSRLGGWPRTAWGSSLLALRFLNTRK